MKRFTYLIILLLFIGNQSFGQRKKIQFNPSYDKKTFHLGFTLGFNSLSYRILPSGTYLNKSSKIYGIQPQSTVGINLGIISDLRMGEYMNLRVQPGMIFGARNIVYTMLDSARNDTYYLSTYEMKIPSIYLDAPIAIKFRAVRINNYRPYVFVGTALKFDLETKRVGKDNTEYTIKQDPIDYFYEFGVGIDWYLVYFKLSTELKYSFGLKNILIQEEQELKSTSIEEIKSRMFVLSLHFE